MTVAIVHDFVTQRGGAERVVLHLASRVREPVIVTSMFAPESTYPKFREFPVWADQLVSEKDAKGFRRQALSLGRSFRAKDLSFADAVIVSTSTFAHHVRADDALIYWHTPPRFLYDPDAYFRSRHVARSFEAATAPLRYQDRKAARSHVRNLANSSRTAGRLARCYGIDADVVHPPFEVERFAGPLTSVGSSHRALVVSRLLPYKRVDLAIEACASIGLPLTVIGQGPDEERLRALSSSSVTFLSGLSEDELVDMYDAHSVVLAPGIEDFGFVPLEAAMRGRPVVAAAESGAAETVIDQVTGFLVKGAGLHDWAGALVRALTWPWEAEVLRASALRFDSGSFDAALFAAMCSNGHEDWADLFVPPPDVPALVVPGSRGRDLNLKPSVTSTGSSGEDDGEALGPLEALEPLRA